MRRCPRCGAEKPLAVFPLRGRQRNGEKRYGYCKPCHAAYQREQKLRREFGIDEVDYVRLLAHQGGCCAICRQPPSGNRLAVDHDHLTGRLRGLLCPSCNGVLGRWHEDIHRFQAAIEYLTNPPATAAVGERYGRPEDGVTPEWLRAAAEYLERARAAA